MARPVNRFAEATILQASNSGENTLPSKLVAGACWLVFSLSAAAQVPVDGGNERVV